jgi:hypothetical protein
MRAAVIATSLVAAAVISSSIWVRGTYGVWSMTDTPARVRLCDQTYTRLDEQVRSMAESLARDPDAKDSLVLEATVGRLPLSRSEPSQFHPGASYNGCGHLVLLSIGRDAYVLFYKLGGP